MRYLLGSLSEEEKARLEEGYFSDDEKFEELEIAEDELIDRYVRGELNDGDMHQFEQSLSRSPRLLKRVQFARVLAERLPSPSMPVPATEKSLRVNEKTSGWSRLFGLSGESRAPGLAMAFVLLVLLGGVALFSGWLRLREESRRLAAQQAALEQRQRELDKQAADLKHQADELANRIPQPSPTETSSPSKRDEQFPTPSFFAFTLSPGTIRSGGGVKDFKIPADAVNVQISLEVRDTDYASYRATVNRDGRGVFSSRFLPLRRTASGDHFIFSIPTKSLSPADYHIKLEGRTSSTKIESVDDYFFRVIK